MIIRWWEQAELIRGERDKDSQVVLETLKQLEATLIDTLVVRGYLPLSKPTTYVVCDPERDAMLVSVAVEVFYWGKRRTQIWKTGEDLRSGFIVVSSPSYSQRNSL